SALSAAAFCLLCDRPPRHLRSFPTRRSSDLPVMTIFAMSASARPGRFVGSEGAQRERMDLTAHALAQGRVDHAVAGQRQLAGERSEEHTSELQSRENLVCRLLLDRKKALDVL